MGVCYALMSSGTPSWYFVLVLSQSIVLGLVTLLVWGWKGGRWSVRVEDDRDLKTLRTDLMTLTNRVEARFEKAGLEQSRLASKLQGLPDELRREFVTKEVAVARWEESQRDREALWRELSRLRQWNGRHDDDGR